MHLWLFWVAGGGMHAPVQTAHKLTMPICHAVKKHPILLLWSVFHKGDIVTGFNAENSKELQFLPRHPEAAQAADPAELLGDVQLCQLMGFALVMRVSLQAATRQ